MVKPLPHELYAQSPGSVEPTWAAFFRHMGEPCARSPISRPRPYPTSRRNNLRCLCPPLPTPPCYHFSPPCEQGQCSAVADARGDGSQRTGKAPRS